MTTVAGTPWMFDGDGKPAVNLPLGAVLVTTLDSAGNLVGADSANNIVFRISPAGVLSVIAGNGIRGFAQQGVAARNAALFGPWEVAVDSAGTVYFGEGGSTRVWKVGADGVIARFAGSSFGFAGDGGLAVDALLGGHVALTADKAGNVYIADNGNYRVRKVDRNGIITTVAGNGQNGSSGDGGPATSAALNPTSLAIDAAGNLYIGDASNKRVRRVGADGLIQTVVGGGTSASADGVPALSVSDVMPLGLAFDNAGNLYIGARQYVYRVDTSGIIRIFAGNGQWGYSGDGGPAKSAGFWSAQSVVCDSAGNVFIADGARIRRVDASGTISTFAGNGRFKFSGDGGPASLASFYFPAGIALASDGSLYVADDSNNRVRKVAPDGIIRTVAGGGSSTAGTGPATSAAIYSPKDVKINSRGELFIAAGSYVHKVDAAGNISIFAGNGQNGFSGDNGPATSAALNGATGLALDAGGNLYIAEAANNRIRKVANGIITTVAGGGGQGGGFSGDGGPATSAQLYYPAGVTVDAAGNLYIADFLNKRVRKVTTSGTISTIAGDGNARLAGDGGPAVQASLVGPLNVTVDGTGNLYIYDTSNFRIRKVDTNGIITTAAGGGSLLQDGVAATSAAIPQPSSGLACDAAGNLYYTEKAQFDRVRKVAFLPQSFAVSPSSLTFSVAAGSGAPASQTLSVTGNVTGLGWSATASTQDGGNWLTVDPSAGGVPASLSVSLNAAALPAVAGTYQGTVTVQAPLASPPTRTVAVTLTVTTAVLPQLAVEPTSLTIEMLAGGAAQTNTLRIRNSGGGSLAWTARAETTAAVNWLAVSPTSGVVTPVSPSLVTLTVNPGSLAAGAYQGTIVIDTATQSFRLPVNLLLTARKQTLVLSQSGLSFTAVAGSSTVPSQSFGVLNAGEGVMAWTATASTFSSGNWLSVAPASGTSDASSTTIPEVEVQVDASGLKTGRYDGLITVQATARNSPQVVSVSLYVLPAGSRAGPLVRPAGLLFAAHAGALPASQNVRVATAESASTFFGAGLLTLSGGEWLEALPRNAAVAASVPRMITVQPSAEKLTPGIYRGVLTLLFDDGSVRTVNVLFVVLSGTVSAASSSLSADAGCQPTRLLGVFRSLGNNFAASSGLPVPLEVQLMDDCGNAVPSATAVAGFSNGDPALVLTSMKNGSYMSTWRPVSQASQITITVRATQPPLQAVEIQASGQVTAQSTVPALFSGGVVDAASYAAGRALAPGTIVSVWGRNMASSTAVASARPLPQTLGGVKLNIGGEDVPLFFTSEGQINAQLPFTLAPNSRTQAYLRVRASDSGPEAISVPETITVGEAQPAIFSLNQAGTGQGLILNAVTWEMAAPVGSVPGFPAQPVKRGEFLTIYCTGLGDVTNRPASGAAASASPLSYTLLTPTVTIGGVAADLQFSGLAPDFVGLYQVNVQVPESAPIGDAVPVTITIAGATSNSVTVAIQ